MPWTRITARWTGWQGGPGYSRMRFGSALADPELAQAATNWRDFFATFAGIEKGLPAGINISLTGTAEIYGDDGLLTNEIAYTPPTAVSGTDPTPYAGASGAVATWHTGSYSNNRERKGRTFAVPLTGVFQSDGTLAAAFLASMQTAATTFASSAPIPAVAWGEGGVGEEPPGFASILSATVPDLAAVLRSRRS